MRALSSWILIGLFLTGCSLPAVIQETEAAEAVVEEALEAEKAVQSVETPPKQTTEPTVTTQSGSANAK